ncbi:MAG: GNAT family protein [Candidatus Omnitrophota bacterium]|nr:GNAT family protein [Candidatus Omnitrophota bacterium]
MKKNMLLLTGHLKIKLLQVSDITSSYVDGLNDPEVNKFLVNARLQKQTKKSAADYILFNLRSPTNLLLGIFLKKPCVLIGTIRMGDISNFHYFCNIGICFFNKTYWGRGYASEVIKKVCSYIFEKLKLHYIEAGVYESNHASMRLFERAGFKIQARYKNKYRYDNEFKPVVIWGLINSKFNKKYLK